MKKPVVIVLALAALVLLLGPVAIGIVAENQFRRISDNVQQATPDFVWVVDEYERGWFSSKARYHLEPAPGLLRKISKDEQTFFDSLPIIASEAEVFHGPIFFAAAGRENISMLPALAHSVDAISFIGSDGERVALPGTVNTRLGFFDRHINIIDITEFETPLDEDGVQGTLRWEGARLKTLFNSALDDVDFGGSIGAFSLTLPNAQITTGRMELNGQQQMTEFGFWAGRQRGEFGGLQVSRDGQGAMSLGSMSWDADIRVDADRVNQDLVFAIDAIDLAGWSGGPFNLSLQLDGLDASAMARLLESLQGMYFPDQDYPTGAAGDLSAVNALGALAQIQALMVHGPELEVRELSMVTPDGTASLRARVVLPQNDSGALAQMLANVEATANLRVPAALAEQLAAQSPDANAQLQGLIAAGFLLRQDNYLVMDVALKGALLTINGQPMPLPLAF